MTSYLVVSPRVARTAVIDPIKAHPKNGVSVREYFLLSHRGIKPFRESTLIYR